MWMDGLFYNCKSLTEVDVANFDMSKAVTLASMFYGCSSLVGGNGTACDGESIVSQAYARPDEKDKPGYFTSSKQGLESIQHAAGRSQKILRDGILLIERNGKTFNTLGTEVR